MNVIMGYVSSTSYQVLWNGSTIERFQASRGVRQGNLLSLYLFVPCMERLSHLIKDAIEIGN